LFAFGDRLSWWDIATEWKEAAQVLQEALINHGLSQLIKVSINNPDRWDALFDVDVGNFVEVRSSDMELPKGVMSYGS
jgi:hypothetical protein